MRSLGRRSITFRLTVLICSASTLVLLALGIMIGEAVERHFRAQDMEVMTGKVQLARHILEKVSSPEKLDAIPHQLEDALIGHAGLEVVIRPMDGPALFQTEQADMQHLDGAGIEEVPQNWRTADGKPYLGTSVRVNSTVAGVPDFLVQVATDTSHQESFMQSFRLTLWSVVALAAFLTGLSAWYVVRREMRPLQSIREEASAITARHLDQRLSTETVPAELTQLVETLNEMLGRLEESFRRLTDFSSDLAHELRTPLSNLLTQTQVTLSKVRTPTEYQDVLVSNTEELERLSRMVSDMLFLAQAENSLSIPNLERTDLRAEAQAVLDFYEALAAEKSIALAITGAGTIQGDRLMLRRALSNLLSNAVRHTPQEGCVGISVAMDESVVRIAVSNTGETIPAEQLPRLFERFYRADASRQRFADGAGLGLAITQSIVKAHGGTISARSSDGLTVFEMVLPREQDRPEIGLDKPSGGS